MFCPVTPRGDPAAGPDAGKLSPDGKPPPPVKTPNEIASSERSGGTRHGTNLRSACASTVPVLSRKRSRSRVEGEKLGAKPASLGQAAGVAVLEEADRAHSNEVADETEDTEAGGEGAGDEDGDVEDSESDAESSPLLRGPTVPLLESAKPRPGQGVERWVCVTRYAGFVPLPASGACCCVSLDPCSGFPALSYAAGVPLERLPQGLRALLSFPPPSSDKGSVRVRYAVVSSLALAAPRSRYNFSIIRGV